LIACRSDGAIGADKSTSPISAAKFGVTGQTVMAMVVPPGFEDFAGLNHNEAMRAIEPCHQGQIGSYIKT
jgi:hypothetical protein